MTSNSLTAPRDWMRATREAAASGETRDLAFRRAQLRTLARMIEAHASQWLQALQADLGKPPAEALLSEVGMVLNDIRYAQRHLKSWMRPQRPALPLGLHPARCRIVPEPRGVVLILAPWNYPMQLLFAPLVSALAAGNRCAVKPSELAPAVSALTAKTLREAFPPEQIGVFEGGVEMAEALLELPFDHIFFTGGIATGRRVMAAAARFPTPVTLELGGKSPCIVCADTDLRIAARRIAWGKFLNAGQTCVAPDYVLVEHPVREALTEALMATIRAFFGPDPARCADYGRIVNARHHARLRGLLEGLQPRFGGDQDAQTRYFGPTLVDDPPADSPVMQSEIFGPILPLIGVDSVNAAIAFVRARPDPLALYLFTQSRSIRRQVAAQTRSGGLCVNDTIMQLLGRDLPFGGIGESGFGSAHGQAGFDTFSHYRPVLERTLHPDLALRYPPNRTPLSTLRHVNRWLFGG